MVYVVGKRGLSSKYSRRRLGKRGNEDVLTFWIWELLVVGMIFIVILLAIRSIVTSNGYWKKYYSMDMALIADLENTNQGDFTVNYQLKGQAQSFLMKVMAPPRLFEIALKYDSIEVSDADKQENQYPTIFPYSKHKTINVNANSLISDFLVLSKTGSALSLEDYHVGTLSKCASLQPFDSHKDMTTLGYDIVSINDETNNMAASVDNILKNRPPLLDPANDLAIILSYEPNSYFTIFYSTPDNEPRSHKLGCLIGTHYARSFPDNSYDVLPYDGSLSSSMIFNNYKNGKSADQFFIILKLSDKEISMDQNDFAMLIQDAVREYYR